MFAILQKIMLYSTSHCQDPNLPDEHNFCSMLIEQLIDLEKVRIDNLKFRTETQDQVIDGWSVTQLLSQ